MTNLVDTVISPDLLVRTGSVLFGMGLRASLLLVLVLLAAAAMRNGSAATRHALIGAGLLAALALPFGALLPWRLPVLPTGIGVPAFQALPGGIASAPAMEPRALAGGSGPSDLVGMPESEVTSASGVESTMVGFEAPSLVPVVHEVAVAPMSWRGWAIALWTSGLLILVARILVSQYRAGRLVGRALPETDDAWTDLLWESADRLEIATDVRLLRAGGVDVPFTVGVFDPAIVLPERADVWDEERRRAVLMHELAHIRRRDILLHHASRWACALYWFNPFVWVAARRLRVESERAADDLVLSVGTPPADYADHLLQIVTSLRPAALPGALLPLARRRDFEGRLIAILEPHLRRTAPSLPQTLALIGGMMLLALPVATLSAGPSADSEAQFAAATVTVDRDDLDTPEPADPASAAAILPEAGAASAGEQTPSEAPERLSPGGDAPENRQSPRFDAQTALPTLVAVPPGPDAESFRAGGTESEPVAAPVTDDPPADRQLVLISPHSETRISVVRALADADEDDPRVIEALIRILQTDPEPEVRRAAAWALAELEAPEAVDALISALRTDTDSEVRRTAGWALAEIEDVRAVDALMSALVSDDAPDVRRLAAWALAEIGDERAAEALAQALGDGNEQVRRTALAALAEFESPLAVPGLVASLSDPDPAVRRDAIRVMDDLDLDRAPPELVAALQDEDAEVRVAAARALGEIEDPSTAAALGNALSDPVEEVRNAALFALAEFDAAVSIDALIRALENPNPTVRRKAAELLGDL